MSWQRSRTLNLFAFLLFAFYLATVAAADVLIENDSRILGVCSRPHLPPYGRLQLHSTEKTKFVENETIVVLCKNADFPSTATKRTCRHGTWHGDQVRCGHGLTTPLLKVEMFSCDNRHHPMLAIPINMTLEPHNPLPPNSFHFTRVPETVALSVNGSSCYRWMLELEQASEISLLLVDLNSDHLGNGTINVKPKVTARVPGRKCRLNLQNTHVISTTEVFGNYFFCDLDASRVNATSQSIEAYNSKYIELSIEWPAGRSIGLEAVFIGETYKRAVGNKRNITDCGKLEILRTGVLEQMEIGFTYITCNSSMVDGTPKPANPNERYRYRYDCNANGEWTGRYPRCVPKQTCSKAEITDGLDESVAVEAVGNVYYMNATHWEAMDYSWVSYVCTTFDGLMIGKPNRLCRHGRWTNALPKCTRALHTTSSVSMSMIISIVVVILIVFTLIVYLAIKFHSQQFNRKLESTREQIEQSALNKAIGAGEYCTDADYEDLKDVYEQPVEFARYETMPTSSGAIPGAAAAHYEAEYLSMTEGNRSFASPLYANSTESR